MEAMLSISKKIGCMSEHCPSSASSATAILFQNVKVGRFYRGSVKVQFSDIQMRLTQK